MKYRYMFSTMIFTALLSALIWSPVFSQSYMSEAEADGFTLKKVVSDTAIATGQNFSYTVYFSIPAGASSVTITDALPPSVSFQSISVTSACGSPTVVTPPVSSMGGIVSLSWTSLPSGCSGSFVVTVNFPNGTTCNGTAARNRVCLTGNIGAAVKADFCTGYVSTQAIAADPWKIGKWVLGAGSQPGPCNYVTADSIVTYRICVWKTVGTTGQLNLVNGIVTDTLPAGATLVPGSSSCGMTQSGNVITWNIGSLSALSLYSTQCCTFEVLYPSLLFPTGSQIQNSATLQGILGSSNVPCGDAVHNSNQTCVEIKPFTSATFSKYVYTNGQPGCSGKYRVWVCNNGSLPINTMTITDTIPSSLTGVSLGTVSSGLTATLSGNIVTATLTTPLLPTQCRLVEIEFTIPLTATVGSTITNCAWMDMAAGLPLDQACASFTVIAPAPKPCIWKEVCSELPSYEPGDVFRYRLRVQNIGGLPITGAAITDVLDPNLQYAGNPSYYTAAAWNAPCQTTSNWSGVVFSQTGNTLTFNLPVIPATCQDLFYNYCGMYGSYGVPFYFIEFDVMVSDTSALGNIPNLFTIGGGNLSGTTTSNTDLVNVVGTSGFYLDKEVAVDTTSWASSVTTTASSNVNYKLRFTVAPGSVGLRHVTFADLLPRDDGANDRLILGPCSIRGSLFDVGYVSTLSTVPSAASYKNPMSFAAVSSFAPAGAPGSMFTGGCGTLGTWAGGPVAGDKNVGYYFGSTPLGAGSSATSVFAVAVPASAQVADSACNTFAANAAVRHLINSTIVSDQQIGQLESGPACVLVDKGQGGQDTCFTAQLKSVTSTGIGPAGECTYDVVLTITNPAASPVTGWFESDQGLLTPAILTLPAGTSTQTLSFTDLPPTDVFVCIRYGILVNNQRILCDSLCFDLPPCGEENPCDSLSVKGASATSTGVDAVGDCTYDIDLDLTNSGTTALPVWFESYGGVITPSVLTIPAGTSTQTLSFTDTPPANTVICIRYGVLVQGQRILCDSICVDLPPCGDTPCDSLIYGSLDTSCCEYDVTIVNAVGSPITSISYYIAGGTVDVITTMPCAPVSPAPAGSTSGVLVYSPPCAGSMGFSIQATPATPSGAITVQLVVHHGQKDSCRLEFTYQCDETGQTPIEKCDKVKVAPFLFTGLNLSGRTFTVFNLKVPASPITHIDIDPVPVPCFLQGGGLKVDFAATSWSVPYTRIPTTGFIAANTQVKFNLGVDYTCNWTGVVNLVIHHADGDSCLYTSGTWDASPPVIGGGAVLTTGIPKRVYGNKLRLQNTSSSKSVKWVSVSVVSDTSEIIAGSGDHWEGTAIDAQYELLDGYEQGLKEALFSFETPLAPGSTSDYFNLIVARDSSRTIPPTIRWTTYDEDGNAIATDTVRITAPVTSIRGEGAAPAPGDFQLLSYFPSPVTGAVTINYVLGRDMEVRLELYNQLGRLVETIEQGFRMSGVRNVRYSTAKLPVGTYYLKLSSAAGQVTRPMVIMR